MTTWRDDLTALADEWEESYERWRNVHDGPRVAIFHAHATRLRQVLAAHPAPEVPEATVVEEWGFLYDGKPEWSPHAYVRWGREGAEHYQRHARLWRVPALVGGLVKRTRTTYADHVTPWVEVETTTEGATPDV